MCRELTRDERKGIRKLVTEMCANYDREYGCLPLDCECYMLGKWWTGAYCRYFREAVLPLDPVLMASICEDGLAPDTRLCAVCGRPFLPEGRQAYCSDACKVEGNRRRSRVGLLRFARRKSPEYRAFPRLFSGREYPNTFCPGLSGYFVTFHPFGPNWPEAGKEETT